MTHRYRSLIEWSEEEGEHGTLDMDCGFSCSFDKPIEFGGSEDVLNPEDAFVGSLAMCFSITFQEMAEKMRLDIDGFTLETEGILEDVDDGTMFTKIYLRPEIVSSENEDRIKRALDLAEDNCLISKSMKSELIIEPTFKD